MILPACSIDRERLELAEAFGNRYHKLSVKNLDAYLDELERHFNNGNSQGFWGFLNANCVHSYRIN